MSLIFVDLETTGLDPERAQVYEIAFARNDEPVRSTFVHHDLKGADLTALEVGDYYKRYASLSAAPGWRELKVEETLRYLLDGNTLVAANPAFDAAFLKARWGAAPWRYRLLDVEAYAMGALGYGWPRGLADIRAELADRGWSIPKPDHTAAGDVETLRASFYALQRIYGKALP